MHDGVRPPFQGLVTPSPQTAIPHIPASCVLAAIAASAAAFTVDTMKPVRSYRLNVSNKNKAATGIAGFDEITGGGLPNGRTTLLLGGPGSGKTIFSLQFLVHGVRDCGEPGIFVAFEESSKRVMANAASFGWKLSELRANKLFFLDAQPLSTLVQSGDFDLSGMLAAA